MVTMVTVMAYATGKEITKEIPHDDELSSALESGDMDKLKSIVSDALNVPGDAFTIVRFESKEMDEYRKMTRTLQWLLKDDNAFNMGRFAFFLDHDDKVAGKAIWDRVSDMTANGCKCSSPETCAWSQFVKGWNEAKNELLTAL